MRLATDPSALLEHNNTRQSRPGLVVAASALTWVLSPLSGVADQLRLKAGRSDIDPQRISTALARDIPSYAAYILLNAAILLAAVYFFRRVCGPWLTDRASGIAIFTSVSVILVSNDVVKAFFWTPHTQMFNILVPIYALYLSMQAGSGALLQRRFAITAGIFTGLGSTAYPLFVIVLPCVAVCAVIFAMQRATAAVWYRTFANFLVLALLAFLPEALWVALVVAQTGDFYQHEMKLGQVVWMMAAWAEGADVLAGLWLKNFSQLVQLALPQAIPLALVSIAVLVLGRLRGLSDEWAPLGRLIATAILVSAVTAAFYASVGLVVARVSYSIIPPLIAVAAAFGLATCRDDERRARVLALACVAVALVTSVYLVLKDGPYS